MPDVIIIGAGMAGMAAAARLQARGVQTLVLEAHGQIGGCAGFFCKRGFSFDVGATTLVDFGPGGVGGRFLDEIGLPAIEGESLPGYKAWLPDRQVTLHRDPAVWQQERLAAFGSSPEYQRFWHLLDTLAAVFWQASRMGVKLPIRSLPDLLNATRCLPPSNWPLLRYLRWTVGDALHASGLAGDTALRGLLGMLIEDTVHSTVEQAPLVNASLGITIRGAGLTRPTGGMRGFWQQLGGRYREMGGQLRVGRRVVRVEQDGRDFIVHTRKTTFRARQVVSTLPIWNTAELGLPQLKAALRPYLERDESALGGAVVLFLGVPEEQVANQPLTHHQIMLDYEQPLGNGNNMFISVSAPGDTASAPEGFRAVMISTHCDLADWEGLSEADYEAKKAAVGQSLLDYARRVYPNLGEKTAVFQVATPRTYQKYTHRYRGAVGGMRLTLDNSNQSAVPYKTAVPGFWQAGDTTWPGLGTVACVLASQHVADSVTSFQLAINSKRSTVNSKRFSPRPTIHWKPFTVHSTRRKP
jgi:C-3',4' desaturase CrtD